MNPDYTCKNLTSEELKIIDEASSAYGEVWLRIYMGDLADIIQRLDKELTEAQQKIDTIKIQLFEAVSGEQY